MHSVEVKTVALYSERIAEGIGRLMPDLSAKLTDAPVPREHLDEIIHSPYHDQLIAEVRGQIVGAAAMSLIMGPSAFRRKAWLEDFVVSSDETIRGMGVGFELWKGVIDWSRSKRATKLEFTSHSSREAAHNFYKRQGAVMRDTSPFEVRFD